MIAKAAKRIKLLAIIGNKNETEKLNSIEYDFTLEKSHFNHNKNKSNRNDEEKKLTYTTTNSKKLLPYRILSACIHSHGYIRPCLRRNK